MLAAIKRRLFRPRKFSGEEMSSLAGKMLNMHPILDDAPSALQLRDRYNALLIDAKRLAASVLSQDEVNG